MPFASCIKEENDMAVRVSLHWHHLCSLPHTEDDRGMAALGDSICCGCAACRQEQQKIASHVSTPLTMGL